MVLSRIRRGLVAKTSSGVILFPRSPKVWCRDRNCLLHKLVTVIIPFLPAAYRLTPALGSVDIVHRTTNGYGSIAHNAMKDISSISGIYNRLSGCMIMISMPDCPLPFHGAQQQ